MNGRHETRRKERGTATIERLEMSSGCKHKTIDTWDRVEEGTKGPYTVGVGGKMSLKEPFDVLPRTKINSENISFGYMHHISIYNLHSTLLTGTCHIRLCIC